MPAAVAPFRTVCSPSSLRRVSMVRPAAAARSRAAVSCAAVSGDADSISQPPRVARSPRRSTPAGVSRFFGADEYGWAAM